MHSGMWNFQCVCLDHLVIEENDIKIENTRPKPHGAGFATHCLLDALHLVQKIKRIQGSFYLYHQIDKPVLIFIIDRARSIKRRRLHKNGSTICQQAVDTFLAVFYFFSQVRPNRNKCLMLIYPLI